MKKRKLFQIYIAGGGPRKRMLLYTALFDQKRRSWVQVKLVVTEKRELVQPRLMYEEIGFTSLH